MELIRRDFIGLFYSDLFSYVPNEEVSFILNQVKFILKFYFLFLVKQLAYILLFQFIYFLLIIIQM